MLSQYYYDSIVYIVYALNLLNKNIGGILIVIFQYNMFSAINQFFVRYFMSFFKSHPSTNSLEDKTSRNSKSYDNPAPYIDISPKHRERSVYEIEAEYENSIFV